jgi:hypothetical protein
MSGGLSYIEGYFAIEWFSPTASRMSAFNAASLIALLTTLETVFTGQPLSPVFA